MRHIPDGSNKLTYSDDYSIGLKVMMVNNYLASKGYLNWDSYNYSRYDEETEEAVIRFQQDMGLDTDGIVGIDTWRAMGFSEL